MPTTEPAKVRVSPYATSRLLSITPIGGVATPTISNAHPKVHIAIARISCRYLIF